jgi:peptidoglycan/xylan/chitin deacetylase (PgdA/CDA1 family)
VRAAGATAAGLAAAHAVPALAAVPGGRRVFKTTRHLDGARDGRVALTFDDGPETAAVDAFVEALAELDVHATFFVVGEQVRRAPEAARCLVEAGHELACHGYRHRNLLRVPPPQTVRDLHAARDTITGETGAILRHFRPPYGVFNAAAWLTAGKLGWERVLWSRWGKDWEADTTPERIRRLLLNRVTGGDILLLHDAEAYSSKGSWRRTLAALEPIVTELRALGLEPGPLDGLPPAGAAAGRGNPPR